MSRSGKVLFALVASVALAGCAGDLKEKNDDLSKQLLDASAENDQIKTDRAKMAQRVEASELKIKELEQRNRDAQQAAAAATQRATELAAAQTKPSAPIPVADPKPPFTTTGLSTADIEKIAEQLRTELGKGGVVSVTKEGNIEVELPSEVTFGSGSAELSEAAKKSLKTLAPELKGRWGPYKIRVEGHTDGTPVVHKAKEYKDNFGMGSARSLSVVRYLESELGIDPARLMSASLGSHHPAVANEKTEADKRKNRRVELVVIIPRDSAQAMAK